MADGNTDRGSTRPREFTHDSPFAQRQLNRAARRQQLETTYATGPLSECEFINRVPDIPPPPETPPRRTRMSDPLRSRSLPRLRDRRRLDDISPRPPAPLDDRLIGAQRQIVALTNELASTEASFCVWASMHENNAQHA